MISPENILSHKHLIRIIKDFFFFLALCDQLVLGDISFLVLNLFIWLFCQLKEEESPMGEVFLEVCQYNCSSGNRVMFSFSLFACSYWQ